MSIPIKISNGDKDSNSIKKGNFEIGLSIDDYSPTYKTGYYAGINVPENGYVIYMKKTGGLIEDGLSFVIDGGNYSSFNTRISLSNVFDISGNGNICLLVNGVGFTESNYGYFIFDGANDYIVATQSSVLIGDNNQNLTISLWIKYTNSARMYPFAIRRIAGSTLVSIELNAYGGTALVGSINILYRNITNTAFNSNYHNGGYNNGLWYNISAVLSSTYSKLYVNGVLVNTINEGFYSSSGITLDSHIGTFDPNNLIFTGSISNVQVYQRSLSDSEILQNYNFIKGRFGL